MVLKLMSGQGQTGKEGIHEGVEVGVRDDSQNDEQVPKHGDRVCGQEESKGGAAGLDHLRGPRGGILRDLLDSEVPC